MHPIDFAAGLALRGLPHGKRVFVDGWGNSELVDLMDITSAGPPAPVEVTWERSWTDGAVHLRHGAFPSPVRHLPAAASTAFVVAVEPPEPTSRVCVLLPAWNDEGYTTRRRLADHLARHGIASLVLEAALYGSRRVLSRGTPMRTVADMALMSRTVVEEGRSLVSWLSSQGLDAGIAGYSMGGSLAANVGATLDFSLALAPLAAAHAPDAVFVDGVLASSVAWEALGADGRAALRERLGKPSPLRVAPTPPTTTAVLVAATRDGFVPAAATEALHRHWPGSELRRVRAGHATLLWRRMDVLAQAIVDSFARAYGGQVGSTDSAP